MSNEIAENSGGGAMALPADLAAAFGAVETNIKTSEKTPHLSIKGKVWKVILPTGEKTLTTLVDGEETPVPTVKVIIIDQIQKRSRVYFPDTYAEGANTQPICFSIDGDTPDSSVTSPQSETCATCDWAAKGSKISDSGDAVMACSQNRRICVVPSDKPSFTPLLLKLPVTSLWERDGLEESQGWYAYDSYLKYLKANGVTHTGMVETRMKFDSKDIAYPKVLFKHAGFVDAGTAAIIAPRVGSQEVLDTLGLGSKPAENIVQTPKAAPAAEDSGFGDEEQAAPVAAAKTTKPKAKKAAKAKAKAKKESVEEVVVETAESDSELDDIMSGWD